MDWNELLKNPESFGFKVESRVVHLDDKRLVPFDLPMFVPVDGELIRQKFGADWLMTQLQGASSIRVQQQNAGRTLRRADATIKAEALLERMAKVVCRIRTGGGARTAKVVKIYTLPDGREFTDLMEARAELAGYLVDVGVPAEVAVEKARAAFVPAVDDEDEDEEI